MGLAWYSTPDATGWRKDSSVAIEAQAQFLVSEIDDAIALLQRAKTAAEDERNSEAREAIRSARFALDVALED